jgi:hypothetical protein
LKPHRIDDLLQKRLRLQPNFPNLPLQSVANDFLKRNGQACLPLLSDIGQGMYQNNTFFFLERLPVVTRKEMSL